MNNRYLYIISFVLIIWNIILIYKIRQENSRCSIILHQNRLLNKSNKSLENILDGAFEFTGQRLIVSDINLIEDISYNGVTPLLLIKKDICETCKDKLQLELEEWDAQDIGIFENVNIVLLDETSISIGSGMKKFYENHCQSLRFINSDDVNFESNLKVPDIFFMLVDENFQVLSSYEFNINSIKEFKYYIKTIDEKIYSL